MGRKANAQKDHAVLNTIRAHDNQLSQAEIARLSDLHPQEVSRILARLVDTTGVLLQEDKKGRLGIFRRKK